jgi:hypothetical protein
MPAWQSTVSAGKDQKGKITTSMPILSAIYGLNVDSLGASVDGNADLKEVAQPPLSCLVTN